MVKKNIVEGQAIQEKYPGYVSRNSSLKFVRCVAAEQNNNNNLKKTAILLIFTDGSELQELKV